MKFTPGCISPGQRFGRLTTVHELPHVRKSGRIKWLCRCDCGKEFVVNRQTLLSDIPRSCGCLNTPEYRCWLSIRDRCHNPRHRAFALYGGRGITVCARWLASAEDFLTDMGPRPSDSHSIDRIDNNGPYSPENCRWATPKQQRRNCRQNRLLTYQGRTQTLVEWAEETGMLLNTLQARVNAGWAPERALTQPVSRRKDNARQWPYSRHR